MPYKHRATEVIISDDDWDKLPENEQDEYDFVEEEEEVEVESND